MSEHTPHTSGNDAPAAAADEPVGAFHRSRYAQSLNRGYSSAMSRGLELAVTLVLMVGLGWLVDRWFGTYPLFTIVFSVVGFAGIGVKLWLGYDLEMRKEEEGAIWNRKPGAAS